MSYQREFCRAGSRHQLRVVAGNRGCLFSPYPDLNLSEKVLAEAVQPSLPAACLPETPANQNRWLLRRLIQSRSTPIPPKSCRPSSIGAHYPVSARSVLVITFASLTVNGFSG